MVILRRLVGLILALAGLIPLSVGAWFAAHLGPSGTATFTVAGVGSEPVVITPQVLNRTDLPVRIDVVAQAAVIGVATPSDASAVLGGAVRREVGAIELPDWTAPTAPSGSGGPKGLGEVELWRVRQEITRAGRLVVDQKTAPESVVIVPGAGGLTSLTLTWSRDTWFYQALVLTAAGALLTTVGGLLLRPGPRRPTITEVSR